MMSRTLQILSAMTILAAAPLSRAGGPTEFTVSSGDRSFRLADSRGQFVALHFLLKTECPYCLRYTKDYAAKAPTVAGVVHVFLKPDTDEEIKAWSAKLDDAGPQVTIYRDPDARLAKAYEIPDGYAFHGQSVHYPALVLLGPDGREVFRYVGKSNAERLPFDRFAAEVAKHSKSAAIAQYNLSDGKPAVGGYDVVAYQKAGRAEPGKPEIASQYGGVTYLFASAHNRAAFAESPDQFVPQYGGWCATAMADGRKVEIDPANFKVTGGRLFLFYKGWLGDALKDWNKDEPGLTRKADENWKKLVPSDAK